MGDAAPAGDSGEPRRADGQRHIQDAVIERSKHLLIETRLPVSEIAYQLGFEYPQHFSRLFKSRTGMTPNEYRLTA